MSDHDHHLSLCRSLNALAVREGFEPSRSRKAPTASPELRLQPLGHLTLVKIAKLPIGLFN